MKPVRASAPGRCGIAGNPSDMYGGSVLSCTTVERATCEIAAREHGIELINGDERVLLTGGTPDPSQADNLQIARSALAFLNLNASHQAFTLQLTTSIPMRAGLAGSTAMLAAMLGALNRYLGLGLNDYALAEAARAVEAGLMGVTCGFQDQHMAVFGGLNFMDFRGKEELAQRPDEPLATVEPLQERAPAPPLILAHTGVQHHSGQVHATPRQRWLEGDPIVRLTYARVGELGWMAKRALVEANWQRLGDIMNENHALVADLGGSGPENERLIHAARRAGALGAKLAGAGKGGTIIALAPDRAAVEAALVAAGAERILIPAPAPGLEVAEG